MSFDTSTSVNSNISSSISSKYSTCGEGRSYGNKRSHNSDSEFFQIECTNLENLDFQMNNVNVPMDKDIVSNGNGQMNTGSGPMDNVNVAMHPLNFPMDNNRTKLVGNQYVQVPKDDDSGSSDSEVDYFSCPEDEDHKRQKERCDKDDQREGVENYDIGDDYHKGTADIYAYDHKEEENYDDDVEEEGEIDDDEDDDFDDFDDDDDDDNDVDDDYDDMDDYGTYSASFEPQPTNSMQMVPYKNNERRFMDVIEQVYDPSYGHLPSELIVSELFARETHFTGRIPEIKHLELLQNVFGYTEFRPMQWQILDTIMLNQQDALAIMATGYGKSLCYQYPAMFLNGITLVICPLPSLIQDQILSSGASNIPSCILAMPEQYNNNDILWGISNGHYKIVYVSPEYILLNAPKLWAAIKGNLILIAIDDVHCISELGHDFRPAFTTLNKLRQSITNIPILAITSTAPNVVEKDIIDCLGLQNPKVIWTGVDRPNLQLFVMAKPKKQLQYEYLLPLINKWIGNGSCIIYCLKRTEMSTIIEQFKENNIHCLELHAGMTFRERHLVHERFMYNECRIVVATIPFNKGIDKPDVHLIIHYGVPKNIECYYHEIGFAGHDGLPSRCVLYFTYEDFVFQKHARKVTDCSVEQADLADEKLRKMKDFCYTKRCRRVQLVEYFDEPIDLFLPHKNCCDNCEVLWTKLPTDYHDEMLYYELDEDGLCNFTHHSRLLLFAVQEFVDEVSSIENAILLLMGSKNPILRPKFYANQLYGLGKRKSENYWKTLAKQLMHDGFLQYQKLFQHKNIIGFTILLTDMAKMFLKVTNIEEIPQLKLKPIPQMFQFLTGFYKKLLDANEQRQQSVVKVPNNKFPITIDGVDEKLLHEFYYKRLLISVYSCTMPLTVASNMALQQLSKLNPTTFQELYDAKIDGFTMDVIHQIGIIFINRRAEAVEEEVPFHMMELLIEHPLYVDENCLNDDDILLRINQMMANCNCSLTKILNTLRIDNTEFGNLVAKCIRYGYPIKKYQLEYYFDITPGILNVKSLFAPAIPNNSVSSVSMKNCRQLNVSKMQLELMKSYTDVRIHLNRLNRWYFDPDQSSKIYWILSENPKSACPTGNKDYRVNFTEFTPYENMDNRFWPPMNEFETDGQDHKGVDPFQKRKSKMKHRFQFEVSSSEDENAYETVDEFDEYDEMFAPQSNTKKYPTSWLFLPKSKTLTIARDGRVITKRRPVKLKTYKKNKY